MKNMLQSLDKSVLIPLGLTAGASVAIHEKILGSGTTTLIISNKEDSGLLIKGITQAILNKTKSLKGGFLGMLLGTLGESLSGNMLASEGVNRPSQGVNRSGK